MVKIKRPKTVDLGVWYTPPPLRPGLPGGRGGVASTRQRVPKVGARRGFSPLTLPGCPAWVEIGNLVKEVGLPGDVVPRFWSRTCPGVSDNVEGTEQNIYL